MQATSTRKTLLAVALGLSAHAAQASTVAVIDSGLDTLHQQLAGRIWLNPVDTSADGVDQDRNGYTDDLYGWNFAEQNNSLIDREYAELYDADVERFFAIQSATLLGKSSDADREWVKTKVQDRAFAKRLMTYGNYAHGTHVSGIVAGQHEDVNVLGIKLIPTKNPLEDVVAQVNKNVQEGKDVNWIVKQTIKGGLILFAKLQAQAFKPIGRYVYNHHLDVANGSFGIGPMQAKMLLTPILKLATRGQEPSSKLVDELAAFFLSQLVHEQQILMRQAPDTLFVFAAGNDSNDNDLMPTAPAGIQHPHVISVAAVFKHGQLAPFSNYGQDTVDLAAPGVAINSAVPDDLKLELSGTSQAAPHVAGTAGAIKAINPDLKASDLKSIIVQTVDLVPALKDKVKSGGVLNHPRAIEAARLSLTKPLAQAIAEANATIASDLEASFADAPSDGELMLDVMPSLLGN